MSLEHGEPDHPPGPGPHPFRVVAPFAVLVTATVADLVDLATGTGAFNVAAWWLIAGGVVAGAVSAPFYWWAWKQQPAGTPGRRRAAVQGAAHLAVVALFAASWALRVREADVPAGALALSLAGAAFALLTACLDVAPASQRDLGAKDEVARAH